ncbi:alternative oxidase [Stereum hirsutum FP-91666 SS1]|uniref:alternative oxidase n=1 Tax=Stereum hirsutum (strain FP-91666) TaxID=721885 RepID=UPI0004449F41|nr:alternative oxidase [Stereum hirsutum FP-91666 SS1]EIM85890.1 alternative oxidase [Stereum hirsutum FP-91666 SS1]
MFNEVCLLVGDLAARPSADAERSTSKPPTGNTTDEVLYRGDWVLFHPVYAPDELKSVEVLHREPTTLADRNAKRFMRLCRVGFDIVSGYRHKPIPPDANMSLEELRKKGYAMDEHAWLNRILFLESIAGVPGMVAATCRHLKSLRLMRRDSGWIHTLLEEAENERMHLMTFMTLRNPGWFFRMLILGAQGVFYNMFFFSYLISPRVCHRFVGYLEEEAVITYSRCIQEMEAGRLPLWSNKPAPEIAKDYWRLRPDATMLDVIYAVRSDETSHRFVNHSLANLGKDDVNPFALREPDMHVKGKVIEFDRDVAAKYVQDSHDMLDKQKKAVDH